MTRRHECLPFVARGMSMPLRGMQRARRKCELRTRTWSRLLVLRGEDAGEAAVRGVAGSWVALDALLGSTQACRAALDITLQQAAEACRGTFRRIKGLRASLEKSRKFWYISQQPDASRLLREGRVSTVTVFRARYLIADCPWRKDETPRTQCGPRIYSSEVRENSCWISSETCEGVSGFCGSVLQVHWKPPDVPHGESKQRASRWW